VAAICNLRRLIGEHVFYTPLPHFFLGGCADEATIRAAVEVAAWANIYFGREQLFLRQTFKVANEILIEAGTGTSPMLASYKLRLPNGSNGGNATWASGNVSGLPAVVRPAGMSQEKLLYSAMAAELRAGLAIDVEEEPSFDRAVGDRPVTASGERYLVVGSSNAQRLHRALQEEDIAADLIHLANMRILRGTGEMLAEKISAAVRKRRPAAINFTAARQHRFRGSYGGWRQAAAEKTRRQVSSGRGHNGRRQKCGGQAAQDVPPCPGWRRRTACQR
jgi:hypothetical protein